MSQRKTPDEILRSELNIYYLTPIQYSGAIRSIEKFAQQEVEARDELIKELRDALKKSIDVIKMWHDSDKEGWADKLSWDTYSQYDPDMTSITNVLTKAQSFNQE